MLRVSDNKRFLINADGSPFFYLGDTAWELFHRLDREQADRYLTDRAAKGFTVIQAVVLSEIDGLSVPNSYGDLPLTDFNLDQPNEAYFKHVDYIVDKAASLGLYVGVLPAWGSHVSPRGPVTVQNARRYGQFLGKRYAGKPVIWILGGDRPPGRNRATWDELAAGLGEGDGGRGLITYHPCGGESSSRWFHGRPWLDFNMLQSGHRHTSRNYSRILRDYQREPAKPTLDGEPAYEYPPDDMSEERPVGEAQVRRNAYQAVFSGAAGHTYGTHPVWQMYDPPRDPMWGVHTPWHKALDLPGARQMPHLKALMLSRPYPTRIPDPSIVLTPQEEDVDHVCATRDGLAGTGNATYLMAYFPTGRPMSLDVGRIASKQIRGWWFDPRTGQAGQPWEFANAGATDFTPPTESGPDWVLVLDGVDSNYPPPGRTQPEASSKP